MDMYAAGVDVHVNEGHRTLARQAELVREKGLYNRYTNPGGAAAPSPNAPHIKVGHIDHAIDFRNAAGVHKALSRRGIRSYFTVSTESWHLEPDAGDLRRYAHRMTKSYKANRGPRDVILVVKHHLRKHGYKGFKMNGHHGMFYRIQLARFRRKHHLGNTSALGPATWRKLRDY
jgi:hypothetical protein